MGEVPLYRSVYENLIEEVDAVDNGVSNYPRTRALDALGGKKVVSARRERRGQTWGA